MPVSLDDDGSEDVNDFLKRIRELGDQRDREDEERNRKLEEEIMQGRRERQARREERARSLSPTKDPSSSNVGTPASVRTNHDPLSPAVPRYSSPSSMATDNPARQASPQLPSKPSALSQSSPSNARAPSPASASLSWQQRPLSRDMASPLGQGTPLGSENRGRQAQADLTSNDENTPSMSHVAQSLSSKDPSWFKQTQDRGHGSAAYRKSEATEDLSRKVSTGSIGLPGMADRAANARSPTLLDQRSDSPKLGSTESSSGMHSRSPMPLSGGQRLQPSASTSQLDSREQSPSRGLAMSPSQGRISPERMDRPASPTKGLGGFVQSAMMKRSDSQTKRWSTQTPTGLNRGNSGLSNPVSSLEGVAPVVPPSPLLGESKPTSISREDKPAHSDLEPDSVFKDTRASRDPSEDAKSFNTYRSNAPPNGDTSASFRPSDLSNIDYLPSSRDSKADQSSSGRMSPSKRWSPQKSSWLENAINKPESPKVFSPPTTPQQPAWMSDLARSRQGRGSVDMGKSSPHKPITTGGLMRSPALGSGYKSPPIGGFPSGPNIDASTRARAGSSDTARDEGSAKTNPSSGLPASKSLNFNVSGTSSQAAYKAGASSNPKESSTSPESSINKSPSSLGSSSTSPTLKQKPDTPPKKDLAGFVSKSRSLPNETKPKDEPEFKNVFGKLKKAQTQNYKAPDELKDNILRGKAGLNITGGPRPYEKRDELKESILKKKQNMVAPTASTKITSATSRQAEQAQPEALMKRQGLAKSGGSSFGSSSAAQKTDDAQQPEALAKLQRMRGDSVSKPKVSSPAPASTSSQKPSTVGQSSLSAFSPAPTTQKPSTVGQSSSFASSLAGILTRGPPAPSTKKLDDTEPPEDRTDPVRLPTRSAPASETTPGQGPQLTHATKGRAKGPKRKKPTVQPGDESKDESPETMLPIRKTPSSPPKQSSRALSNITNSNDMNRKPLQPEPAASPELSTHDVPDPPTQTKPKVEHVAAKPPPLNTKPAYVSSLLADRQSPLKRTAKETKAADQSPSVGAQPASGPLTSKPQDEEQIQPSVRSPAGKWGETKDTAGRPKSPIKLPTRADEETARRGAGLVADPKPQPPAQATKPSTQASATATPKSPPILGKKPIVTSGIPVSSNPSSPSKRSFHVTPSDPANARLLTDIFGDSIDPKGVPRFDTQTVLDTCSTPKDFPKIKTLRKQIVEVVDNGKTLPVASDQEHILFEDSLYLCTHVFGTPSGQRMTEVYLWCGDGTSTSAAEDAQLFAKKVAKENNGPLIVLKQGHETSNFFQALGGIMITRRGSSGSSGSSATYMLRGRQHLGQLAFDEVDFHPSSLSGGFPHIISARFGKLYIWKGQGAGADELGCARLIGMDLGLTGEIEEVEQGREPDDFWSAFPTDSPRASPVSSLSYLSRKPTCEQYANRLFSVDVEAPARPKSASAFMAWGRRGSNTGNIDAGPASPSAASAQAQIREIVPFGTTDLYDDQVYMLDNFFETFVIHPLQTLNPPPHRRSTKPLPFRTALLFAQEYGILAASAQDRPFVPQCSVVFLLTGPGDAGVGVDAVPEGMRIAFRKWTRPGQKCRVLALADALESAGVRRES